MKPSFYGYTMLEIIIYIALIAFLTILVVGSVLSIYKNFTKSSLDRRLAQNGDVALETMVRIIRAATTTDLAVSTFNTSPGVLKVGDVKFSISDSALQMQESVSPAQNLTSDASITNLIFYRQATSTPSQIIKIEFTLKAGFGLLVESKNFYGSAVLRGAY